MFTPTTRRRKIVSTTPPPISPRPNRAQAPLHQPTVKIQAFLDAFMGHGPPPQPFFEETLERFGSNTWSITEQMAANYAVYITIQWLPEVAHLDAALNIDSGSGPQFVGAIANFGYPGIMTWQSGPRWWDGWYPTSKSTLNVLLTGPWQPPDHLH